MFEIIYLFLAINESIGPSYKNVIQDKKIIKGTCKIVNKVVNRATCA